MYYTVTFNPAVDLVVRLDQLQVGEINRGSGEDYVAGGKGINMSVVLKRLGVDNIATGFIGGFSGNYLVQALEQEGVQAQFISLEGITRVNVKIKALEETEINGAGPFVTEENFQALLKYFEDNLQAGDSIFLAGNKAPGLEASAYTAIAALAQAKGARLVLDTTRDLLTQCLPYHPFLIKPNHLELGEIFGLEINSQEDLVHYAGKLQEMGAQNVLISRGGQGALLLTADGEVYRSNVPKGQVVNSVGAGDSMLAGFMAQFSLEADYAQALAVGAATGSATAFSVGIAEKELIDQLLPQISVEKLS